MCYKKNGFNHISQEKYIATVVTPSEWTDH